MKYHGSCHCGQIKFEIEAEAEVKEAVACNCSMCQRKGSLLWFIPRHQLNLLTPPENMRSYTFNKHVIQHYFCPNCGIHPFGEGTGPDGQLSAAVNIRCLDEIDLDAVKIHHFNGRDY
jgi:hypothetical protein